MVKIGKQLKFSLVNVAGNDIVQGNKKLILGMLSATFVSSNLDVGVKTSWLIVMNFLYHSYLPFDRTFQG